MKNFRMIERHYFQGKLLKSCDFDFSFMMPKSRNSVEHIYEFPTLTDEEGMRHSATSLCSANL